MQFPQAIPEVPVSDLHRSNQYYATALGFQLDWCNDDEGIGGISQGDCRLFLADRRFRQDDDGVKPIVVWLNLNSREEVDQLHHRWRETGAKIVAAPEDKPWRLREFTAADPDGNRLRVFYDFTWESRQPQ